MHSYCGNITYNKKHMNCCNYHKEYITIKGLCLVYRYSYKNICDIILPKSQNKFDYKKYLLELNSNKFNFESEIKKNIKQNTEQNKEISNSNIIVNFSMNSNNISYIMQNDKYKNIYKKLYNVGHIIEIYVELKKNYEDSIIKIIIKNIVTNKITKIFNLNFDDNLINKNIYENIHKLPFTDNEKILYIIYGKRELNIIGAKILVWRMNDINDWYTPIKDGDIFELDCTYNLPIIEKDCIFNFDLLNEILVKNITEQITNDIYNEEKNKIIKECQSYNMEYITASIEYDYDIAYEKKLLSIVAKI
jgi:hypothetical protein